jgi:hypothetical protein
MAACVEVLERTGHTEMSYSQLRSLIEKEANALGLTAEDAISRVKNDETGTNYLWQDLTSLVHLLYE